MTSLQKTDSTYAVRAPWDVIYETTPCLPIKNLGARFPGHQSGGRIVAYTDEEVLVTVGDFERDGIYGEEIVSNPNNSYGKLIAINPSTLATRVVSTGHRNPQGLYIDAAGTIWSTEHGPEGGDELNVIRPGADYGWPHVTYGTEYGKYRWTPSATNGEHSGYEIPRYAWVPSIGVSELIGVQSERFDQWKGDLLVASLKAQTLYRMRVREERIVYAEPLAFEDRIRSIAERSDGAIALLFDVGYLAILRPDPSVAPDSPVAMAAPEK